MPRILSHAVTLCSPDEEEESRQEIPARLKMVLAAIFFAVGIEIAEAASRTDISMPRAN
jgi:hypothetical protein